MGRDIAGVPVIRTARLALLTSGATACSRVLGSTTLTGSPHSGHASASQQTASHVRWPLVCEGLGLPAVEAEQPTEQQQLVSCVIS